MCVYISFSFQYPSIYIYNNEKYVVKIVAYLFELYNIFNRWLNKSFLWKSLMVMHFFKDLMVMHYRLKLVYTGIPWKLIKSWHKLFLLPSCYYITNFPTLFSGKMSIRKFVKHIRCTVFSQPNSPNKKRQESNHWSFD